MAVVLWFTGLQVQHLCCGLVRFWSVYWQETLLHSGDFLQNPETGAGGEMSVLGLTFMRCLNRFLEGLKQL